MFFAAELRACCGICRGGHACMGSNEYVYMCNTRHIHVHAYAQYTMFYGVLLFPSNTQIIETHMHGEHTNYKNTHAYAAYTQIKKTHIHAYTQRTIFSRATWILISSSSLAVLSRSNASCNALSFKFSCISICVYACK
jgi:hypothetical protein